MAERLPEWNDLPETVRCAMVARARYWTFGAYAHHFAGDLAADLYRTLRETLPAEVFPLFGERKGG